MKIRSVKSMLLIFMIVVISANVVINYVFLSSLQRIHEKMIYEECYRASGNIRNEFEQTNETLHMFAGRIYLKLFQLDYFQYGDEKAWLEDQRAVQECVDLLNQFMNEQMHILVIDQGTGTMVNYSRILSGQQLDVLKEAYESMKADMVGDYECYRIIDMDQTFWILELRSFFKQDYDAVINEKCGCIMTMTMVNKQELYEKYDLPGGLDVFISDSGVNRMEIPEEIGEDKITEDKDFEGAVVTRNIETVSSNYVLRCRLKNLGDVSRFEDIRMMIWIQLCVNILFTILGMYALVRYIANPLHVIVRHMKAIDFESKQQMTEHFVCSEINVVAGQFNQLIDRLYEQSRTAFYTQQRLYEMELCEKERNMKALQSQINPHFIYNMLENIRVLAEAGRNEDVARVTVCMADFLRYSLYVNGFVTLEDELKVSESYLEIMKICYDNMFRVEYSVEEQLRGNEVPKMILQPLIGNVFKHGFTFEHSDNVIRMEVGSEDGQIFIRVFDNGAGIEPKELARLNKELAKDALLEGDKGFGLYSINRRLKTIYGEKAGVSVESVENAYTKVTIRFPKKREGV